jgi:hypothetical protein
VEDDGVVEAVDELGVECPVDLLADLLLDPVVLAGRRLRMEPQSGALADVARPEVRGHDDDRVLEVDHPAELSVRMPLVEHLEEDVEHVRVRLLDLVEEHHRVRLAPDLLRELPESS